MLGLELVFPRVGANIEYYTELDWISFIVPHMIRPQIPSDFLGQSQVNELLGIFLSSVTVSPSTDTHIDTQHNQTHTKPDTQKNRHTHTQTGFEFSGKLNRLFQCCPKNISQTYNLWHLSIVLHVKKLDTNSMKFGTCPAYKSCIGLLLFDKMLFGQCRFHWNNQTFQRWFQIGLYFNPSTSK